MATMMMLTTQGLSLFGFVVLFYPITSILGIILTIFLFKRNINKALITSFISLIPFIIIAIALLFKIN